MTNVIIKRDKSISEIVPIFSGREACNPSHTFGPHAREHYLIHFCISGRGTLEDKYGSHEIVAGEMFIIRPSEITVYRADENDPWEYVWLAFTGSRALLFTTEKSVYKAPDGVVEKLAELVEERSYTPDAYLAIIHALIDACFSGEVERDDIVSSIKQYIQHNYMEPLSVSGLADVFSFERSYLFRIFKERYGVGIKEYITHVRMERAKAYLADGKRVADCAAMVGYTDEFNFSRSFKKQFGISPREWQSQNKK